MPAAMDGVAGVTRTRCRSAASSPIASWPIRSGPTGITHTRSPNEQVIGGLFGTLVVLPKTGRSEAVDVVAAAHSVRAARRRSTVLRAIMRVLAKPGQQVRVRVINTDNGPIESWGRRAVPGARDRRLRSQCPDARWLIVQ